jgi:hypothetical protein
MLWVCDVVSNAIADFLFFRGDKEEFIPRAESMEKLIRVTGANVVIK